MSYLLAWPIALAAALPTTLAVLALWVAHSRIVDGDRADAVFLSFVFLFVPLIFFVAIVANLLAVAGGQLVALAAPAFGRSASVALAGLFVWAGCTWTQRGAGDVLRRPAPVSLVPVLLFACVDMLILAGGLCLLPANPTI